MAFPLAISVTLGTLHFTPANQHALLPPKRSSAHEIRLFPLTFWHFWSKNSTAISQSLLCRNGGHCANGWRGRGSFMSPTLCCRQRKMAPPPGKAKSHEAESSRNENILIPPESVYYIGPYKERPRSLSIRISQTTPWAGRMVIIINICERDLSSGFSLEERIRAKTRCGIVSKLKRFQVYHTRFMSMVSLIVNRGTWPLTKSPLNGQSYTFLTCERRIILILIIQTSKFARPTSDPVMYMISFYKLKHVCFAGCVELFRHPGSLGEVQENPHNLSGRFTFPRLFFHLSLSVCHITCFECPHRSSSPIYVHFLKAVINFILSKAPYGD